MKAADTMDYLNDLESRFDVEDWEHEGTPLWPIIRTFLGLDLMEGDLLAPRPQNPNTARPLLGRWPAKVDNLAGYLKASLHDGQTRVIPSKKADVVFLGDSATRMPHKDRSYHRICDPLIDAYKRVGVRCEHFEPLRNLDNLPRTNPSIYLTQPFFNWLGRLNDRSPPVRQRLSPLEPLARFYDTVRAETKAVLYLDEHRCMRMAAMVADAKKTWVRILRRIQPKIAYSVLYYNFWGWSYTAACRELGIPCVELPHGRQDPCHHAYGRWTKRPATGYKILPSFFWTWSESESQTFDSWSSSLPTHKPFVGGNPLLRKWRDDSQELESKFRDEATSIDSLASKGPVVMALPQYRIKDVDDTLQTIASAPKNWQWLIRMHPLERYMIPAMEEKLKELGIANAIVELPTNAPLYLLLKRTRSLLTGYSSTILEAIEFDIRSVSTMEVARDIFPQAVEDGWLTISTSSTERIALLEKAMRNNARPTNKRQESLEETLDRMHRAADVSLRTAK